LDAIYEHIARDSPTNAAAFTARIRGLCEGFSDFGERGRPRPELGPDMRIVGFERRVAVVFRVLVDRVQIVRILYGGRDVERILKGE
jgi:toxin ParE1/3/4